jgi:pimeloyl-ACP methyl ester carboxylesterase
MPLASGWENPDRSAFFRYMERLVAALKEGKSIGPIGEAFGRERKPSFLHKTWVKLMTGYFNDKEALIALMESLEALALTEEEVKAIQVPMLTVVGGKDILLSGAKALNQAAPHHKLVIVEGADHVRAIYREETRKAIMTFLKDHPTVDLPDSQ